MSLTCCHCGGPRVFRSVNHPRCWSCDAHLDRWCTCTHREGCDLVKFVERGEIWLQTYQETNAYSLWTKYANTDQTWRRLDFTWAGEYLRTFCPTAYRGDEPPELHPHDHLPKERHRLVATS